MSKNDTQGMEGRDLTLGDIGSHVKDLKFICFKLNCVINMFFGSLSFLTSFQHSFSNLVFKAKLCLTTLNLNKNSRFFKIKCALNTCAIALLHLNWDMENKAINFRKIKEPFNWLQTPLHRNLSFLAIKHIWND